MQIEVFPDAPAVALAAARFVAAEARAAVQARGRFLLAVSGGTTPWEMLRALAREGFPWPGIHLFQVDERVAPAGHADRNLTHLIESLAQRRCVRSRFTPCRLRRPICLPLRMNTARRSPPWLALLRSSIWFIWVSAPTVTPHRSFPAIRFSK